MIKETGLEPTQEVTADLYASRIKQHSAHLNNLLKHIRQNINPFSTDLDVDSLYNISTGQAVQTNMADFLLIIEDVGDNQLLKVWKGQRLI